MHSSATEIDRIPLVVVCGPTASGKTALVSELAGRFDIEVVSADSCQVYRGLDIGTAKATAEERSRVRHHLIDVADPDQNFTAGDFVRLARQAISDIRSRGKLPVVAGGTGLYIRALAEGLLDAPKGDSSLREDLLAFEAAQGEGSLYRELQGIDPVLAARLHPGNLVRIVRGIEVYRLSGRRLSDLQAEHAFGERPYRTLSLGISPERSILYERINARVGEMMAAGLVEEVRSLLEKGYSPELKSLQTIGYREIIGYLYGDTDAGQAVALIQRNSRRYAKRQLTWFRADKSIIWVDSWRESARIQLLIEHFMHHRRSGHGQDPV